MISAVVPHSLSVGEGRLGDSGFLHPDHQDRQLVEQIERDEDDSHREWIATGSDDGSKDKQDDHSVLPTSLESVGIEDTDSSKQLHHQREQEDDAHR